MLPQGGYTADHQICACLGRILNLDIQASFQARANNKCGFTCEFLNGGLHRVKHLRNNGSNDGAFDVLIGDAIDLQQHLQVDAVFIGCFGGIRAQARFKTDFITLHAANYNIRITNING